MFEAYSAIFTVITLLLSMIVLQALIATVAHRKQTEYIPGVVRSELDHHSFVFRSNRTFLNSLENVPVFIMTLFVAILTGIDATELLYISGLYFIARLIHMILFYAIATNKNPSPRSYFYMIGLLTQLYLLGVIFVAG